MISLAAGMATTGRNVFACSFAMFTAGRAFEQIRNACAYPHLNVKVVGTYAGITVGEDGATPVSYTHLRVSYFSDAHGCSA